MLSADELSTTVWHAVQVGADQLAHLRVDQVGHRLPEDPLAYFLDVLGQPALGGTHRAFDHALELLTPEPVRQRQLHQVQELTGPDLPVPEPVPGHRRDREPGDQRAVQVEERANVRAFGAGLDFSQRSRDSRAGHEGRLAEVRRVPADDRGADRARARDRGRGRPSSTTSSKPS